MISKKMMAVWFVGGLLLLGGIGVALSGVWAQGDGANLTLWEADMSVVGDFSSTPGNELSLQPASSPPTNLTKQDYYDAYLKARALFDKGADFRSHELQRLDPETCVGDPDNSDACSFSVTGVQNNYLDFNDGRLYWRFCADYDEPYVGVGGIDHDVDDPDDELKIDPFGYCPFWDDLTPEQKTRRVSSWQTKPLDADGEIDIRNALIAAQRLFAVLAVADPTSLAFDANGYAGGAIDELSVDANGHPVPGSDGFPDRVQDLGVYYLLKTTREIAGAHMIFGNEFMVDALRYPFSTDGLDTEEIVRDEQRQLERALRQYDLAVQVFIYALNYHLGGPVSSTVAQHFTDQDFQIFTAASERSVAALTEIAKRDRLLGQNGDQAALARLEEGMLDQYFQALALSYQSTELEGDDPATADIDEGWSNFLDNGGRDILNNIHRLSNQMQNIQAGLNPLGFEETYVPLKPFEDLLELTCGGRTVCSQGAGLLNSALLAGQRLRDSQREFDENYQRLLAELTSLQFDYDNRLTELCGPSEDTDGDGLKDFIPCGFFDENGNGTIDDPEETGGLLGQNYWNMLAAEKELSLAVRQVENNIERIRIEEERAGRVINVTLETGQTLSAYQLAIGKLNAYKTVDSVATSSNASAYFDTSLETEVGTKVTAQASGNPLACVFGGCDVQFEAYMQAALKAAVGTRLEFATISTSEMVWSPNDAIIGQFQSLSELKQAERDATIEGANSEAEIRNLLLEQSELLKQVEVAQAQLNEKVTEHNMLVSQYLLAMSQRASTVAALQESVLSKPYFRLFRDGAALEAARTLDQAQQSAYLTAKALEYMTLSPVSYLNELYRVRNPANLRAFLDKLARDYAPIPPEKFSKISYRISLAKDIFGLTDEVLNPDGQLTPAQVEELRYQRFQDILKRSRITNTSTGYDRIVIPFATTLDDPEFLKGVFNNRISRTSSNDPGCAAGGGCRGVWINLVTDQDEADFGGDHPIFALTHAGEATYRNGNLKEVSYDPGPALMVGRTLPAGFGGNGRERALMPAHLNLPPGAEPDPNLTEDNFFNLSIATTQWNIQIDLTNPTVNTRLDLTQLRDIELRMDTTYVTPSQTRQLVELDKQRVALETAGRPVSDRLRRAIVEQEAPYRQMLREANARQVRPASAAAAQATAGDEYMGTLTVLTPLPLGDMDMGFSLIFHEDGSVTGTLCPQCGPLYDAPDALNGVFDGGSRTLTMQTGALPRVIAGRDATRQITFHGQVSKDGDVIEGTYVETITGFIAEPIVTEGTFLVSRQANIDFTREPRLFLTATPVSILPNASAAVLATLLDGDGQPMAGVQITFSADMGVISPQTVTTDANGVASTTFTAGFATGPATIIATPQGLNTSFTLTIWVVDSSHPGGQTLFLPIVAHTNPVTTQAKEATPAPALGQETDAPPRGRILFFPAVWR